MFNRMRNAVANAMAGPSGSAPNRTEDKHKPAELKVKYPYSRPEFLLLNEDEVQVSADHLSRPILVPREPSRLPWNAGYAEVINGGKTKLNEDQARADTFLIRKFITGSASESASVSDVSNQLEDAMKNCNVAEHAEGPVDEAEKVQDDPERLGDQPPQVQQQKLNEGESNENAATEQATRQLQQNEMTVEGCSSGENTTQQGDAEDMAEVSSEPERNLDTQELAPVNPDSGQENTQQILNTTIDKLSLDPSVKFNEHSPSHDSTPSPSEEFPRLDRLQSNSDFEILKQDTLPVTYFAIFDGHAGTGAALMAVNTLHDIIQEQLATVRDLIIARKQAALSCAAATPSPEAECSPLAKLQMAQQGGSDRASRISADSLVIGALEQSFCIMDHVISKQRRSYRIVGGCTALVAVFFMGKLYVANAGDSRAVISRGKEIIPMSNDFSPESERQRIQVLAEMQPELLYNEFTPLQFPRKMTKADIGKPMLFRNAWMEGWSLKAINEADTRIPIIHGEGKKTRLLATIGVTRGFGDHDLRVYESPIYIKPFLSPFPQVLVYNEVDLVHTENDVLVMGSDGLWDVMTNYKVCQVVQKALSQFPSDDASRYTSAAQELVMNARGLLKRGWRTPDDEPASGDDITVLVIPLNHFANQNVANSTSTESSLDGAAIDS